MPQPLGCYRSRTILRYLPRETDFPGDAKNGGPRGNATSTGLTATLSKFLSRFMAGSRMSLSFPEKRRAALTTFGTPWSSSDKLDAGSRYTSRRQTDIAVTWSDWMSVKSNDDDVVPPFVSREIRFLGERWVAYNEGIRVLHWIRIEVALDDKS